jgi:tetratricopeptide (TPR) repeat protein
MGSSATLSGWAKRLSWVALLLISVLAGGPAAAEPGDAAGALLADGRLEEAAAAAQACAAAEARCALVLGRARLAQGAGQQAAEPLAGARGRAGSLEPTLLRLLGEALLKAGRAGEAAEPLAAAIQLDPAGPAGVRAAALLADALFAAGHLAEAAQQAQRAAALPGQPPEVKAGLSYTAAQALAARAQTEPPLVHEAALALRSFWLQHPEHPGAQAARDLQRELEAALPAPSGRELLVRASRLLAAGQPAAAVAQAQAAAAMLTGEDAAEAQLLYARALAADGRRTDAAEALQRAWKTGAPRVAAQAGLLFARDRARRDRDADAIRIAVEVSRKYPAAPEAEEAQLFVARLELDAGNVAGARAREPGELPAPSPTRSGRRGSIGRRAVAPQRRPPRCTGARPSSIRAAGTGCSRAIASASRATSRRPSLLRPPRPRLHPARGSRAPSSSRASACSRRRPPR